MEAVNVLYYMLIIMFILFAYCELSHNAYQSLLSKIDISAISTEILLSVTTRLSQFSVNCNIFLLTSEMEIFLLFSFKYCSHKSEARK